MAGASVRVLLVEGSAGNVHLMRLALREVGDNFELTWARGLAAALALLTRDRGEIELALQLLVYPMLDDRSPRSAPRHEYRLWSPRSNRFGWAAYLGATDPEVAVPARRDDLTGLAPAWIGVGTCDLLHDEALTYAERLRSAGVPCHVEVVPGAFHSFDRAAPKAQVSREFFAAQCAALCAALGPHD